MGALGLLSATRAHLRGEEGGEEAVEGGGGRGSNPGASRADRGRRIAVIPKPVLEVELEVVHRPRAPAETEGATAEEHFVSGSERFRY